MLTSIRKMIYISTFYGWIKEQPGFIFFLFVLTAAFALAAFFRFWAAPLSAGPDIIQFRAFAQVFESEGLDFYKYADATDGSFPYWGWAYVYPPIWLLILRAGSLITPGSLASTEMVDEGWRLAVKTPIILADLAIGALIFWAVPGSRWKKLLFASIWLFHPTGWYESSVFGQFDAVATAFLIASVVLFARSNYKLGFLFAGLAVMTKQHTFLPVLMVLIVVLQQMGIRDFIKNGLVMAGVILAFSIPFLITGNFRAYAEAVFLPGWSPGYQEPLCYAFSGSASLLTYLHNTHGWETSQWLGYNTYVLAAAMLAALTLTFWKKLTLAQAALIGILLFIAINYQVNYQYLVIFIPLALLVSAQSNDKWQIGISLGIAILPAVWLWLFDVSFWFHKYQPPHYEVISTFDRIGLVNYLSSNKPYVIFAVSLMLICLAYVAASFISWHRHEEENTTEFASARVMLE
ncbi:MAG: hypothetical protein R6U37_00115 [Dehalococcoidia bacterium]